MRDMLASLRRIRRSVPLHSLKQYQAWNHHYGDVTSLPLEDDDDEEEEEEEDENIYKSCSNKSNNINNNNYRHIPADGCMDSSKGGGSGEGDGEAKVAWVQKSASKWDLSNSTNFIARFMERGTEAGNSEELDGGNEGDSNERTFEKMREEENGDYSQAFDYFSFES